MDWGDAEQWLSDVAREDGKAPPALVEKPSIPAHLQFAWSAFWALANDRQIGFGVLGPIPFSAIDRYSRRYGVASVDEFDRLAMLVRAMDGAWLERVNKKDGA